MKKEDKPELHRTAREVLDLFEFGFYEANGIMVPISAAEAIAGTVEIAPEDTAEDPSAGFTGTQTVVEATAGQMLPFAAARAEKSRVAVLNFASGTRPGGGFLRGARAQEEDLCRSSGLYLALARQPQFYERNQAHRALSSEHLLWTPNVPFFRAAVDLPYFDAPVLVDVITAAAPNLNAFDEELFSLDLHTLWVRRWRQVFSAARSQGAGVFIGGAWGCGVFGNDPALVSRAAQEAISAAGSMEIIWAVPYSPNNLACFTEALPAST